MTSLLAVFGFLAAVLSEGHSLSCEKCLDYSSTSCPGSIEMCNEVDDKCFRAFENNTVDGDTLLTTVKACHNPQKMPPFVCEAYEHSVRNSNFYLRLVANCGQEMGELKVPPINFTSNGYKCPDCFKGDTVEKCKTDKVIECVGRQTECFNYRGKTSRPGLDVMSYSAQGCSTPGFCSLLPYLPGTHADMSASTYSCSPASKV